MRRLGLPAAIAAVGILLAGPGAAQDAPPADPAPGQPSAASANPPPPPEPTAPAPASQTPIQGYGAVGAPISGASTLATPYVAAPTGGVLKGMTLQDIDATMGAAEAISDIVGSWIGPKPPPRPEFRYEDSRGFDMQLHQSLAAKLARVNVSVDGRFATSALPERVGNWLSQVRRTGGTVSECVIRPEGSRGILFVLELVLRVIQVVDRWRLYQPAKSYNVVVLVNEQGRQVLNLVFQDRTQPQLTCPGGATPQLVP